MFQNGIPYLHCGLIDSIGLQRSERSSAGDSMLNSTQQQSESAGFRGGPSSAFGLPTAISMGQPPVDLHNSLYNGSGNHN